jgi:uncharacterized membrane protein required for colicin V production
MTWAFFTFILQVTGLITWAVAVMVAGMFLMDRVAAHMFGDDDHE